MDFNAFFSSPTTRAFIAEAVQSDLIASQQGNPVTRYLPRVTQDVTRLERNVVSLAAPIIAADIAPLSQGRSGEGLQEQRVSGNLIDSGAKYEYEGAKIEQLRALLSAITGIPGDVVTLRSDVSNRALESYFGFMRNQVLEPIYMNMNKKAWTLLRTGKAWADNSRDDDFTRPPLIALYGAEQTTIVTQAAGTNIYGGVDADFFKDLQDAVNRAAARGYQIREVVMSAATRQQILSLESTRVAVGGMSLTVASGGQLDVQMQQGNATAEAFNAALAQRDLPPVRVLTTKENTWRDQVRAPGDPVGPVGTYFNGKYVPDGVAILIPEATAAEAGFVENEVMLSGVAQALTGSELGIHLIGRPTAQDEGAKIYTFGPYYERSERPSLRGSGIVAHMPFLAGPAGFEVIEYATK